MLKLLLANQEAQKAEISIMKEELALVKEENQRLHEKLDDIAALVHPEQPQTVICRSGPHRTDKLAKQRTDPHVFQLDPFEGHGHALLYNRHVTHGRSKRPDFTCCNPYGGGIWSSRRTRID